jgi:hypothetical protein
MPIENTTAISEIGEIFELILVSYSEHYFFIDKIIS